MADWDFYGRSYERRDIEILLDRKAWFFCAITGRRRIGKTTLIREALVGRHRHHALYFQVPDSEERGVAEALSDAIADHEAPFPARDVRSFAGMAKAFSSLWDQGWIIIADEFQYFNRKALSPFASHLQAVIDERRTATGRRSSGGLFALGSIHTEMMAVLEDQSSPLFARVTDRLPLGHWDFATIFEVMSAHGITDPRHVLFLWSLFEGVPKFYRDCHERGLLRPFPLGDSRRETIRAMFLDGSSPLRDEADTWFLREFRGRYDRALKLLARFQPCGSGQLEAEYARDGDAKQFGSYLKILHETYRMVERRVPVFGAASGRKARYAISDNFLSAWLAALERASKMARIRPVADAVEQAIPSLDAYEGVAFEKLVRQASEELSRRGKGDFPLTDQVSGYWNKPLHTPANIEIDIVFLNDNDQRIRLGSCKRSEEKHDADSLSGFRAHVARFLNTKEGRRHAGWRHELALYAPSFSAERRAKLEAEGFLCRDINDFRRWLA